MKQAFKQYASNRISVTRKKCLHPSSRRKCQETNTEISRVQARTFKKYINSDVFYVVDGIKVCFCSFYIYFFLFSPNVLQRAQHAFLYNRNLKSKLLKKQQTLKLWVMNEWRFFLPRNSASHSLEVQPRRVTTVRVLSPCQRQSVQVTHKALSVKAQPSNTQTPRDHRFRKKSLHFSPAMSAPFIIGYR